MLKMVNLKCYVGVE